MTETTLKTFWLKNGLTLDLLDLSKKIAGDRWHVSVVARMDIPVNAQTLGDFDKNGPTSHGLEDILAVVGDNVTFEKKMERNFISDKEKAAVLNGFVDSFSQLSVRYMDRPDFTKNYILMIYKEKQKRQTWYR